MLQDVSYRSETDKGLKRGAIHEPDYALAGNGVLPKNVRLAIPVEVARTSDAPRCIYRCETDKGLKRGAIHEPDYALAGKVFCQRMSALPSPLKSPEPAMLHDVSTVAKLTVD